MKIEKTTVVVDGHEHEIEVNDMAVLVPGPTVHSIEIKDDRVRTITAFDTVSAARELPDDDWQLFRAEPQFVTMWNFIFDFEPPENLQQSGNGVLHIVGMIILICDAIIDDKVPHLQYPESFLHPRAQAGLADLLNYLMNKDEY